MAVGHSAITVDQLLSSVGLTANSIDKQCSDNHILEISCFLENWELVTSSLGLEPPNIEEIKHDYSHDLNLMRLKSLQKWRSLFVLNATYRVLLEALLISGCTDQAYQVCRLLNPIQGTDHNILASDTL